MAEVNNFHSDIKTWKERNKFLFKNEIMSDCSFIVIDGLGRTIIPAHKYILGGNSADFYNLFYLMKSSDEIPIKGTSIENFILFLEFLYTEKTKLTIENVEDQLKLAKRFSVNHFEDFCCSFLTQNVTEGTALTFLEKYSDYLMPDLTKKCIQIISNSKTTFESPSFLKITIKTLTEILKSKELKGFREITIYNGVNKWAENFCQENQKAVNSDNKRLAVKPAIKYIRFASMTFEEFTSCTLNNSILINSEIVEIMQFFGTSGETDCSFSAEIRSNQGQNGLKKLKFFLEEPVINKINRALTVRNIFSITVDKPIYFNGFGILGRALSLLNIQNPEKFKIELRDEAKNVVLQREVEIYFDGSEKTYDVLFYNSLMLKPNVPYYAYVHRIIKGSFLQHCFKYNGGEITHALDGIQINIKVIRNSILRNIFFSE